MAKAVKKKTKFSKETYIEWFELMTRIREFETRCRVLYTSEKKIRGFLHLCIGQEAISAGIKSATRQDDPVITAYRSHGNAIAKGISMKECMAELMGKETGCVKGKGGSMHFFSKEKSFYGGHGIVGAQIGLGAGLAFAEQYKGTDNVCICMFGDGAARQGILHETYNMAMKWKLPVVFICENNHYAMGTSVERTTNVLDIYKLGLGYEMPSEQVDALKCENVHNAVAKAVQHCRDGKGPYFLEFKTYRYQGHSISDAQLYRTRDELEEYRKKDSITDVKLTILDNKWATEAEIKEMVKQAKKDVKEAIKFAEDSDFPDVSELYTNNYVQEDYPFLD